MYFFSLRSAGATGFLLLFLAQSAFSQSSSSQTSMSIAITGTKEWRWKQKYRLQLRQNIQVNPESRDQDQRFGDIFNEEDFLPAGQDRDVNARRVDTNGGNGIIPEAQDLFFEWRGSTGFLGEWRPLSWMRASTGYTALYSNTFRHRIMTEVRFFPFWIDSEDWQISPRLALQQVGARDRDDNEMEWTHVLIPRVDLQFQENKRRSYYVNAALNGEWDDGELDFDRYRLDFGVRLTVKKLYIADLSYRFQHRFGRKTVLSHGLNLNCSYRF